MHSPHAEVGDIFIIRHSAVTHFQHIQVVPSARLGFVQYGRRLVKDIHDRAMEARKLAIVGLAGAACVWTIERVVDIPTHPPRIGHRLCPVPWVILAPIAHRVQDRSAGSVQSVRHGLVAIERDEASSFLSFVVAIVVFEVICICPISPSTIHFLSIGKRTNAPISKRLRILLFITQARRVMGTGEFPSGRVHAESEPHTMQLVRDIRHPIWKSSRVGLKRAIGCSAIRPAIIEDDVVISLKKKPLVSTQCLTTNAFEEDHTEVAEAKVDNSLRRRK